MTSVTGYVLSFLFQADLAGMAIPIPARRIWPTFLLALFLVGTSPAIPGDRPDLTYRTGTSEVRLTFSATDQNDRGVATLAGQ